MAIIIETKRLRLRDITMNDVAAMIELNSDPDVVRYTGDGPFESAKQAEVFFSQRIAQYKLDGFGRWIVELKSTGEIIGWCGLKKQENGSIDVGYRFYKRHWGKGFGTESCKAAIEYGFEKLKLTRIIAEARIENIPSIRIMEKCGMKFACNSNGCDGDTVVYEIHAPGK